MLTVPQRMEANSILDRLTEHGDTFAREDAIRLVQLVPTQKLPWFAFMGSFLHKGGSGKSKGYSPGVGNVEIEGKKDVHKDIKVNIDEHRIGGYKVIHFPGKMTVRLMWAETREDPNGQSCTLIYDDKTLEPKEMKIAQAASWAFWKILIHYVKYVPWKVPQ